MQSERKIQILIIGGALSQNHGAEAMTLATIELISENIPNSYIFIGSIRSTDINYEILKNKKNIKVIYENYNNILTYIRRLIKPIFNKLFNIRLNDRYLSVIKNSDLIIDVSGDTISDIYSDSLIRNFWRYLAIHIFKRSIIFFPQSFGPFNRIWTRIMVKFILENSKLIFVREKLSYKYMKSFLKKPELIYTLDSAFYLEKAKKGNIIHFKTNKKLKVGISLSQKIIQFSREIKHKKLYYEKQLKTLVDFIEFIIREYKCIVYLVPHVNNDRIIQKQIYDQLNTVYRSCCINIMENHGAKELKYIISKFDMFIGFRMHSNIAALSSNVPTIAISYSHKYIGIMKIFSLEDFVINIIDLNLNILKEKFLKLYINKEKIKENLKKINMEEIEKNKKILVQNLMKIINIP